LSTGFMIPLKRPEQFGNGAADRGVEVKPIDKHRMNATNEAR
jgi:hypothetical protein